MAPSLKLYNTLARTKEAFRPIDPSNVRMYVCGPTVYDFAHIGNARPIIVFDLLFRLLRHLYGPDHVTYVRNVTDVDDKINARAAERGIPIRELTDGTLRQFHEDIRALGVLMPEDVNEPGRPPRFVEPRATDHIEEMKALIERLVAAGHAYVAEEHALFHVPSMPDYGALSKRPLDEMEAGARVDVAPYKRSPLDFVLWKPSKPGEPSWASPAGIAAPGRPGWHIECSAMSWKHLGETFDIHAGGIDLVFPHHENEVAQSRCCFNTPVMANYWLHNGFLQVEGEKMSKSLGNFVTIRELLATDVFGGRSWPGNVLRFAMLETHYRQPINWSLSKLSQAEREIFHVASELMLLGTEVFGKKVDLFHNWLTMFERSIPAHFLDALSDDLNTPAALAYVRQRYGRVSSELKVAEEVLSIFEFLGVFQTEGLFLSAGPVLSGIVDPEAVQGAFLLGRKIQIAQLNRNDDLLAEALSESRRWGLQVSLDRLGMLRLSRDTAQVKAQIQKITDLVQTRSAARAAKNWAESDRIRDELAAMGIALKDNKDGTTTWEVAR